MIHLFEIQIPRLILNHQTRSPSYFPGKAKFVVHETIIGWVPSLAKHGESQPRSETFTE